MSMNMVTSATLCVLAVLALSFFAAQAAQPAPVGDAAKPESRPAPQQVIEQTQTADGTVVAKLSNGLTVIVKAVKTAPVVCVRSYVNAGSMYEREWLGCGLSHLVEHLVAGDAENSGNGAGKSPATQPVQASKLRSRITEIGGQSNASTTLDHTQYYISAASGKAMECIDLIAEWMVRPGYNNEDFEREHGVVQRELEMDKDIPMWMMWETHAANQYGDHPAAVPTIGYAVPLNKVTFEDVKAYHARMYVPQNMVFVVVGDVDVQASLDRVCQAFAGFNTGRGVDLSLGEVRPVVGVRRTTRQHPSMKEAMQTMAFLTIPLLHEDLYALDVLAGVLGDGESSRLNLKIERKQLVTSISCGSWTPHWGRGAIEISFRAKDSARADLAEKAILDELKSIVEKGVTDEELARVKRQKVAELVYSQQNVEVIAGRLASDFISTGNVLFSRDYTKNIQAVTAEQVRKVASKYLTFDQMVITRLVPPEAAKVTASGPAAVDKSAASTFTLPNGLKVVMCPTDSVGLVSMTFMGKGGIMLEDEKTNGMGDLMMTLTTKGAGKLSAEQIADFFDNAGGTITAECAQNSFYWQASVLDDSFDKALEITADIVQHPTFEANELEIARPQALAAIDRVEEQWQTQLLRFFREKFFTNSPYRFVVSGKKEVVSAVTAKQLAEYHRKNILAGSSVLTIYGHFNPDKTKAAVEKLFADMPKGQVELTLPAPREVKQAEVHVLPVPKDRSAAGIIVAMPGMKANDEDRFALNVLKTIISGWRLPSGWLHTELRGKQLVYVIHTNNLTGFAPGAYFAYAACQPEKAPEVIEIINKNLRKASSYLPTSQEINEAVNTILTAELLGAQTMAELSLQAAINEQYGFGYQYQSKLEGLYRKVTPADVQRVAKKYLSGQYVTIVTTAKPELITTAAEKADGKK